MGIRTPCSSCSQEHLSCALLSESASPQSAKSGRAHTPGRGARRGLCMQVSSTASLDKQVAWFNRTLKSSVRKKKTKLAHVRSPPPPPPATPLSARPAFGLWLRFASSCLGPVWAVPLSALFLPVSVSLSLLPLCRAECHVEGGRGASLVLHARPRDELVCVVNIPVTRTARTRWTAAPRTACLLAAVCGVVRPTLLVPCATEAIIRFTQDWRGRACREVGTERRNTQEKREWFILLYKRVSSVSEGNCSIAFWTLKAGFPHTQRTHERLSCHTGVF